MPETAADRQGRGRRRRSAPRCGWSARPSTSALAAARERAAEAGLAFVHPFDDPEVIAGQGGLGLELLAQVLTWPGSSSRSAAGD